tara:strand:+ start:32 stop:520 length:489 start_codon:yes stop_codon:yes gene_type:complete
MALTKVTERIISDNLSISGVATAGNFKTGTTNVHNVGVELAGINVLGGDTPIGTGATIWKDGGALFSGIVTSTKFVGDGSELTGVSGFATALGNDTSSLLNQVFKTPEIFTVGAGTSVTISSDNVSGNVAFARLGVISVGVGATLHVGTGTTMKMNILNVFP